MHQTGTIIKLKAKSKHHIRAFFFIAWCALSFSFIGESHGQDQKVGVVLSGGGATAAAHVGFLKALEENEIPVDYIVGSSMGAIVGAFYAAGYSTEELEAMVSSKEFLAMSTGLLPDTLSFFLKEDDPNSSIVNLKFNPDAIVQSSLPTHLVDPGLMDFRFIELFGPASAAAGYDFDSLFIPYRAVASDIELNESVVFRGGELNLAARTSGTFPFYMEPLEVDGKLMFDGGLYNNYPADVLNEEFSPDVILGCNVSQIASSPDAENLMSQLINMIQYKTNFENVIDNMITIEPVTGIGTFDFDQVSIAISAGYQSTLAKMDSVKLLVSGTETIIERKQKRSEFRALQSPILIKEVNVTGIPKSQQIGIERNLKSQREVYVDIETFRKRFFRIYSDTKVRYAYPTIKLDPLDKKYVVTVHIKPEKRMEASFGGNFSSRPINMGFIQLKYNVPSRNNLSLKANSYFGKFYSSTSAGFKMDFNLRTPLVLDANVTYNSWDYFNSFATFLEEVKPSFIIKNEQFADVNLSLPVGNRGKIAATGKYSFMNDDYYQTDNFTNVDTTDQTNFKSFIVGGEYLRSTLNRKQFADRGSLLSLKYRFINGEENTIPGSTSELRDTTRNDHSWSVLKMRYMNFFEKGKKHSLGFNLETVWANQPRFNNYRATLIRSSAFEPIPESKSFFINSYRSNFYSSAGLIFTYDIANNFQFRTESYVYRPWERIFPDEGGGVGIDPTTELFYVGSGSLIFHSPLGPLRLTLNYYDRANVPWSLMFNYGYFIFNKSAVD